MLLFTHILSALSLRIMESCYVNLMNLNSFGSEKKIAKVMGQTSGNGCPMVHLSIIIGSKCFVSKCMRNKVSMSILAMHCCSSSPS